MRKFLIAAVMAFALAAPAIAADEAPYIAPDAVDFSHIVAQPPQPGSAEQQREIAAVLTMRANADDARRAMAIADAQVSIFRFADVLGPKFREGRLPKTTAFFARVQKSTGPLTGAGKTFWHHDRPWVMDGNVAAPDDVAHDTCNSKPGAGTASPACPNGVSYSYPGGHSSFGTVTAILLAEMVPEKRDQLLARGRAYGESRIINGVHFPTDIEAGRIEGTVMVVLMMQNPAFRSDLAEARAELRKQLGLPPAP